MSAQQDVQQEYQQELEKIQKSDFTHSWISSSGFLFYLHVGCLVAFFFGACSMLYTKRYQKITAPVQESSLYTPKYK
jgi:hypothetical protein